MNSAAPSMAPGFLKRSWNALNSAFAVGLILALAGWAFQLNQTRVASAQTFNLTRVSELSTDGEKMDRSIVLFYNAAAEQKPLEKAREAAKQAIVDHSLKVESVRSVIGAVDADSYLLALDALNQQLDRTVDRSNAGPNQTVFGRVIELRRSLIQKVRDS